jgi:hypothetical protein
MDFKEYVEVYEERISKIKYLFCVEEVVINYDNLKTDTKVDNEQIFCKFDSNQEISIFVFGSEFYEKELGEQEFKKVLGQNVLNYKIYNAYNQLKLKNKKIKIVDILNKITDKKKDSCDVHRILRRILTLAYYYNWDLKKDKKDFEGDYFVDMNPNYLIRLNQVYDFDIISPVYENSDLFVFLNKRGKLNFILKQRDIFSKYDVENLVIPALKKVFKIKRVVVND